MNIVFDCPICGRRYEVGPQQAGAEVLCLGCNSRMLVPNPVAVASPANGLDPLRPAARLQRSSVYVPIVYAAVAGGVITVLLVVCFFVFFGGKEDPPVAAVPNLPPTTEKPLPAMPESTARPRQPKPRAETAYTPTTRKLEETESPKPGNATVEYSPAPEPVPVSSSPDESSGPTLTSSTVASVTPAREPPEDTVEWGSAGSAIVIGDREKVTFGAPGCPCLVVGTTVWDIQSKKIQARLQGSYEEKSLTSLSPDGRFFAATELASHEKDNSVVVWDTATGGALFVVPGAATESTALVELAGDRLFLGFASSGAMTIWSVTQGREERVLELSERSLEDKNTAITHNGLYVAYVADRNRMVVLKVDTGATVARMRPPKKMDRAAPDLPPGMVRVDRGGWIVDNNGESASANDCTFIYAWLQALEFSPDSHELAGVSTHPKPRVICWDYKGKRAFDEPLYSERRAFWENSLTWFPGKKAWLIEHDIFERESGKVVLSVQEPFAEDLNIHVLDDDHLIGSFPHSPDEIQVLDIPWEDIHKSLTQLKEKGPALLGPDKPVSIVFELGPLRGNQNQTVQQLGDALKKRLQRDGLNVQKGEPTFFRMRFSEQAGDSLAIRERQSPFDWRGRDTGRRATEAQGQLVVELVVPGKDQPIWRDSLRATSSRSFDDVINDTTVRNSMIENLSHQLQDLNFPYFIPQSEEFLALPVILE